MGVNLGPGLSGGPNRRYVPARPVLPIRPRAGLSLASPRHGRRPRPAVPEARAGARQALPADRRRRRAPHRSAPSATCPSTATSPSSSPARRRRRTAGAPSDPRLLGRISAGTEVRRSAGGAARGRRDGAPSCNSPAGAAAVGPWWIEGASHLGAAGRRRRGPRARAPCIPYETACARRARLAAAPRRAVDRRPRGPVGAGRDARPPDRRCTAGSSCAGCGARSSTASAAVITARPRPPSACARRCPSWRAGTSSAIPIGFDAADFAAPPRRRARRRARSGSSTPARCTPTLGLRHRADARRGAGCSAARSADVDILTRSHVFLLEAIERAARRRPGARGRDRAASGRHRSPPPTARRRRATTSCARTGLLTHTRDGRADALGRPAVPADARPAGRAARRRCPLQDLRVPRRRAPDPRRRARRRRARPARARCAHARSCGPPTSRRWPTRSRARRARGARDARRATASAPPRWRRYERRAVGRADRRRPRRRARATRGLGARSARRGAAREALAVAQGADDAAIGAARLAPGRGGRVAPQHRQRGRLRAGAVERAQGEVARAGSPCTRTRGRAPRPWCSEVQLAAALGAVVAERQVDEGLGAACRAAAP